MRRVLVLVVESPKFQAERSRPEPPLAVTVNVGVRETTGTAAYSSPVIFSGFTSLRLTISPPWGVPQSKASAPAPNSVRPHRTARLLS